MQWQWVSDKYLAIRQHSRSSPVFTLDIADNYPLPNHIIIENITGRDTEMGSSIPTYAFSYPQLDQLHLTFSSKYTFKNCIKIIPCSSWVLLQDWTLLDFLLGDGNWIKEIGQKNLHIFGIFVILDRMQLQIICIYKIRRLVFFVPAVMFGHNWKVELEDMERRIILHLKPASSYKE